MTLTRRAALAGAAALPWAVQAQPAEKLTFVTPFGFIVDFLEMLNAVTGGHLQRQGFDATLLGGNGSAQAITQVVTGQAKFLRIAGIDMMKAAIQANVRLVSVASLYQEGNFYVISPASAPVRNPAELNGKRVGVVSIGGSTENLLDLMLTKAGFDPKATRRDVVGNSPGALALVAQGRIDCFIASTNVVEALREQNAAIHAWLTDEIVPMPSQTFVCTQETIDREPETVTRFLRAMRASCEELLAPDVTPMIRRAADRFEIPGIRNMKLTLASFDASRRSWLARGRENLLLNNPAQWEQGAAALTAAGIVRIPDHAAFWTNRFAEAARA